MRWGILVLLFGCGARTDVGGHRVELDASIDAPHDAPNDVVIITDAGCTTDAECNDSIACTLDACDPALHVCTHAPRDAMCDDGIFCDGTETCDPTDGCLTAPLDCSDAVTCTVDACDEASKSCTHTPDDSLCPISHVCDPDLGCQAHALAHDDTTLYDVRLPSGQVNVIGSTGSQLTDVALSPSNVLYGIGFDALYTLSQQTGAATLLKNVSAGNINGADVSPDGTLWISGGTELAKLDAQSGAVTFVASFPSGSSSSGDLAWVGPRLLATATGKSGDELVEFDVVGKTSKVLGPTGFDCIWGLAGYGPTLYGLTCEGRVLSIDAATGAATQLTTSSATFWGASAR
ncbi:MAG TPA: hypothetical protein VGH28_12915 [Polyangiaceae bacterium]|jgi:hypothetical protein